MKIYYAGNLDNKREEMFSKIIKKRLISWYIADTQQKKGYVEWIMKLYLAGFGAGITKSQEETYYDEFKIKELRSYNEPEIKKANLVDMKCVELFIDSGAFSAWTKGVTIDIDKYIEFIHKWKDKITVYANLDVIPGKPNEHITQVHKDHSAKQGWENLKYMESNALKPMHIFHQGEDFVWLKKLMDEYEYFGVSPGNDYSTNDKDAWLHDVFSYLCDADGTTKYKTHGFGVTSERLMETYPWYSVDSTTWILTSRFGSIMTPYGKILFSSEQKSNNDHYNFLHDKEKEVINEYLMEHNTTPEKLGSDYKERDRLNIIYLQEYERNYEYKPVPQQSMMFSLMDGKSLVGEKK